MKIVAILLTAFALTQYASAALSAGDGMTLLWHFDDTGAVNTLQDASGNGNHGTVRANSQLRITQESNLGFSCRILNRDAEISTDLSAFGEDTFSQRDWTLFFRFRNPTLSSNSSMFVARGSTGTAEGSATSWNLAFMPTNAQYRGCMRLALFGDNGTAVPLLTEIPDWRQDVWYTLAIVSSATNGLHNYKIYLSPDTAGTIGHPILDSTPTSITNLASGPYFIFGGARNGAETLAYGGYFNANVDETALWLGRALRAEELNALRNKTTGNEPLELNSLPLFHYSFDEQPVELADGSRMTADVSGNGRDGVVRGGVRGGAPGGHNSAYTGFTNQLSFVACTNLPAENPARPHAYTYSNWTYLGYYRMPKERSENNALLARGSNSRYGQGSDNAWTLYLTPDNRVSLSFQNWEGKHTNFVSEAAVQLPPGDWMQVAVCRFKDASEHSYTVYMTPWGASEVVPAFSVSWPSNWTASECMGTALVIGGGERGYYQATQTAGWWGGSIDEARFFDFVVPEDYLLRDLRAFQPVFPALFTIR